MRARDDSSGTFVIRALALLASNIIIVFVTTCADAEGDSEKVCAN